MAKDQTKRLIAAILQSDKDSYAALQSINGYNPNNPAYALTEVSKAKTDMESAQAAETQAAAALATARDNAVAAEWAFHNKMLGTKDQVIAQFGKDSNEVQEIGLKKVSEYKARARRAPTSGGKS